MAGLAILTHTYNLSNEGLCARWIENPYFQFFCGEEFFLHELPFDRSSMTRWRQRMGEERVAALLKARVDVILIDTAHGHSHNVIEALRATKREIGDLEVIAGNVATSEGAKALIDAGADGIGEAME